MSLQLQPGNSFTVVRQLNNPYITDTFYVKAVIRNAYTDAILDTLQLTDKGGQRFKKDWQVPADASGQGFYISIVTSVYSDSGYTTKSENYGDEESTYLIADRLLNAMRGGGDNSLDLFSIRNVIKEELEKAKPEAIKIPKQKVYEMRWDDILSAIDSLGKLVDSIPKEHPDFSTQFVSLKTKIDESVLLTHQAIDAKETTPPTDLSPIEEQLRKNLNATLGVLENVGESLVRTAQSTISQQLGKMKADISFNTAPVVPTEQSTESIKSPLQAIDLNKLSQ